MAQTWAKMGRWPPAGVSIDCLNRIPQARGLGSSSAAIVAGVVLARELVIGGRELLPPDSALAVAAELEGHPDNVAACLMGGLTIAWADDAGHARAARLELAASVRLTVFVPAQRGLTAHARSALPATVPHRDAAHTAGRAALLVHALTGDPSLLFDATEDRLHQRYRADGMPATAAVVERLRAAKVAAVISGAGPSVLALTSTNWGFPDLGPEWRQIPVASAQTGGLDAVDWQHAEREPVAASLDS
jgi:homoserine kinase